MTVHNKNDAIINYDHGTRIARLETTIENINQTLIELKSDMKAGFKEVQSRLWQLVFFIFALSGTILGVMAHGFKWI